MGEQMRGGGEFASAEALTKFIGRLDNEAGERRATIRTHRMAFPRVEARRTNGHLQGIAAHFDCDENDARRATLFASVSEFPVGWSACLIEQGVAGGGEDVALETEMLAIPHGRHAGGINVCDGVLVVPMEHNEREGSVYFYEVAEEPLHPRLLGSVNRDGSAWPELDESDPSKASAAGMARLAVDENGGWTHPVGSSPEERADAYLVVVLSEHRYLRFFHLQRTGETLEATETPKLLDAYANPEWSRGWVDGISLLNTDEGWRLIAFSADGLGWFKRQRKGTFDRENRRTRETIAEFGLVFGAEGPELELISKAEVEVTPGPTWRDFCWPSFRWGASIAPTGFLDDAGDDEFALLMVEWFGNEESIGDPQWASGVVSGGEGDAGEAGAAQRPSRAALDEASPAEVMYAQFATNLEWDPFGFAPPASNETRGSTFGYRHAAASRRPPVGATMLRGLRDGPAMVLFILQLLLVGAFGTSGRKRLSARRLKWLGGGVFATGLAIMAIPFFADLLFGGFGLVVSAIVLAFGALVVLVGIGLHATGRAQTRPKRPVAELLAPLFCVATVIAFVRELPALVGVFAALAALFVGIAWARRNDAEDQKRAAREMDDDEDAKRRRAESALRRLVGLFALSVGLAAVAGAVMAGGGSSFWVLIIGALLLVVLTMAKVLAGDAVRSETINRIHVGSLVVALSVVAIWVAGGIVSRLTDSIDGVWLVLRIVAGWAAVFALSIWGAAEYGRGRVPRRFKRAVPGLVLVLASMVLSATVIPDLGVVLLVVSIVTVIGIYFVWPGEGSLALGLFALLLVFAAFDTDADDPAVAVPIDADGVSWVVALGDSFISGEGAERFVDGTNRPGENVCRRSATAWPVLVTEALDAVREDRTVALKSFACSGAELSEGLQTPQASAEDEEGLTPVNGESATFAGTVPQLDALAEWIAEDNVESIDYILISGGGNDAGFVPVIEACLLPGNNCADSIPDFTERAAVVETEMTAVLEQLDDVLGAASLASKPTVVVNPYIDPLGPEGGSRCGSLGGMTSLLDAREVEAVRGFHGQLNSRVKRGVDVFGSGEHIDQVLINEDGARVLGRLCRGSAAAINWLAIQPADDAEGFQENIAALQPSMVWLLGSVHPNELGHQKIAVTMCRKIAATDAHLGVSACEGVGPYDEMVRDGEIASATAEDEASLFPPLTCRHPAAERVEDLPECNLRTADPSDAVVEGFRSAASRLAWMLSLALLGGILIGVAAAERRKQPPPKWLMKRIEDWAKRVKELPVVRALRVDG